jgi:glutamate 5-kinase
LIDAVAGQAVGTRFEAHDRRLSARKLWIGFASGSSGTVVVDDGARRAVLERGTSLLPAGVTDVQGAFDEGDTVEVAGANGVVFARGLVTMSAVDLRSAIGKRSGEAAAHLPREAVHRDDLVLVGK